MRQLEAMLLKHAKLFASEAGDMVRTYLVQHAIHTGDSPPIRQQAIQLPHSLKVLSKTMQEQEMLEEDVIRPSPRPWSFPVVLVKEKDGLFRFCVDYRKLNAGKTKDSYPLSRIDEALDNVSGLSFRVLAGGPSTRRQASDRIHVNTWSVRVQRLTNVPSTFQRLMEAVLVRLSWEKGLIYL